MNVSLRVFSQADIQLFERWIAGDLSEFMSRFSPRSFAQGRLPDDSTSWYVILADGRDVGCIWVERDAADDQVADLGIFLAAPEDRGRGIGKQALKIALNPKTLPWHLRKIRLRVRESNMRAIGCYMASGFLPSGRGEKLIAGRRIPFVEMMLQLGNPFVD